MNYEKMLKVGKINHEFLKLMKEAVKYRRMGCPVKDVMDDSGVQDAMESLLKILTAAKKEEQ